MYNANELNKTLASSLKKSEANPHNRFNLISPTHTLFSTKEHKKGTVIDDKKKIQT